MGFLALRCGTRVAPWIADRPRARSLGDLCRATQRPSKGCAAVRSPPTMPQPKIDSLSAFEPEQPAPTPDAPPPEQDDEESGLRALPAELLMWVLAAVAALILLLFQYV